MAKLSNKPSGKIKFIAGQVPALLDGDYVLSLSQSLSDASGTIKNAEIAPISQAFSISGPQYSLSQSQVEAVFPPAGSTSVETNVLPHIALNRLSLPWERNAGTDAAAPLNPWLLVLAVAQSEGAVESTQTLKDLAQASSGNVNWPGLSLEPWQDPKQTAAIVDLPASLLRDILPQTDDLQYLAHIRQGKGNTDDDDNTPMAIIMGNRLPAPGTQYKAYLVSVEGRYTADGFDMGSAKGSELVRFISLQSWSYSTLSAGQVNSDFKALLQALDHAPGTLQLDTSGLSGEAKQLVKAGYVPANHFFRDGSQSASWYRGPFLPGDNPSDPATAGISLPVPSSDALLRFWPDIAMFDATYAAAWELGRLIILQNSAVALQLQRWKQTHTQQVLRAEQSILTAHLPLQKFPDPEPAEPDFGTLDDWFTDLSLLKPVPFNYLIPNEQLLPQESIRFIELDPIWLDCLIDGAFSVGTAVAGAPFGESKKRKELQQLSQGTITGFLLRSAVVQGWPDMQIAAYDTRIDDPDSYDPSTDTPLPILRQDFLSDTVLLCLFAGKVKTLDLSKRPDSIHMGVSEDNGQFSRPLRDKDGEPLLDKNKQQVSVNVPFSGDAANGLINIQQLAQKISRTVPGFSKTFTAAEFAMEMVEGVDKVRFVGE